MKTKHSLDKRHRYFKEDALHGRDQTTQVQQQLG